jgi:hypothetical protein
MCFPQAVVFVFPDQTLRQKSTRELFGCLYSGNKKHLVLMIAGKSSGLQTSPRHQVALHGQDPKKIFWDIQ